MNKYDILIESLTQLSKEMVAVGLEMQDFIEVDEVVKHGVELMGAAELIDHWVAHISDEDSST